MKMSTYSYTMKGHGKDEQQTWETTGVVTCEFPELFGSVTRDSFVQLTHGKAVFGQPGVGCKGPYDVTSIEITKMQ